uniref:Programmed cell death protein 2 C-terminal domain-containing protein n=1 Tax=Odontella aurita TaxID=265563 RepID=A0A7S4IB66_9STRA|mmetsp:Transcript_22472/g.66613  ORF Transcript_22472/g.66613 Transcript_22472/m.66613 type:complete len:182 (+) Transcript_22472:40-585(+)
MIRRLRTGSGPRGYHRPCACAPIYRFRPTPSPPSKKEKRNRGRKSARRTQFPSVPPCTGCGSERTFEMQLAPALLLALDVDGHALLPTLASSVSAGEGEGREEEGGSRGVDGGGEGGMNWGSIAVYCCPLSCDGSRGEALVMQRDPTDADGAARRTVKEVQKGEEEEEVDDGDDAGGDGGC